MSESVQKKSVGFLDKLKGLVAEEVPDRPTRQTPVPAAPSAARSMPAEHHDFASGSAPGAPGVVGGPGPMGPCGPDPAALAKLEARLQASCPAAYVSFMEQHENLKEIIPDEGMRFKAAMKASHTTPDVVLGALAQLIAAMEEARTDFTHSFEENKDKKLKVAEESIAQDDERIKASEEQIKAIQETITSLRTKRAADVENMQHEAARFENIRGGFEAAHHQVTSRLSNLKDRLAALPKA